MTSKKIRYLVGIDEVGRGPIAGPVTIGVCMVALDEYDWLRETLPRVTDSKQLSGRLREDIYINARNLYYDNRNSFWYTTVSISAPKIDQQGVSWALNTAIKRGLRRLERQRNIEHESLKVVLDGKLYAPANYQQETIIKGDQKEFLIGLASIMAKVKRDRYMIQCAKLHPAYNFQSNKGYGTGEHYRALHKHGVCVLHRKSYLGGL